MRCWLMFRYVLLVDVQIRKLLVDVQIRAVGA